MSWELILCTNYDLTLYGDLCFRGSSDQRQSLQSSISVPSVQPSEISYLLILWAYELTSKILTMIGKMGNFSDTGDKTILYFIILFRAAFTFWVVVTSMTSVSYYMKANIEQRTMPAKYIKYVPQPEHLSQSHIYNFTAWRCTITEERSKASLHLLAVESQYIYLLTHLGVITIYSQMCQ